MHIQSVFVALALAYTATAISVHRSPNQKTPLYVFPNIADISHATPSLVEFCHMLYTAKSLHNFVAFASLFTPGNQTTYFDAIAGIAVPQSMLAADLTILTNGSSPDSISYPLRIIGDLNSAVILSVDTPGLFGPTEIRAISAVDFKDGKAARWIDYWDARGNPAAALRVPDDQFPTTFGESSVKTMPNTAIQNAATKLYAALSSGNSTAASDLFTADAVFEDRSLNTRIEGQSGIKGYLQRVLPIVPYGVGSTVRHIVGSGQGGAYEWIGASAAGSPNGITVLELDSQGQITAFIAVWDASRTSNTTVDALVGLSISE